MNDNKFILDACCGGRCFWFDKTNENTIYIDIEPRSKGCVEQRPNFSCEPDIIADFRDLPFENKKFKHIIWDPPHLQNLQDSSFLKKKYGSLNAETWQADLKQGFSELWRVLDDYGTLVFKWSEDRIPIPKVLSLFPISPLYGHPTAKHGKTKWMIFVKIPKQGAAVELPLPSATAKVA